MTKHQQPDLSNPRDMAAALEQFPTDLRTEIMIDAAVIHQRVKATRQQFSVAGATEAVTALYVWLIETNQAAKLRTPLGPVKAGEK